MSINVPYRITSVFGPNAMKGNDSKGEVRYYCPECSKRHGSPDTKGKLYVNVRTYAFNCFRCGYKGFISKNLEVNENRNYEEDKEVEVDKIISDINSITKDTNKYKLVIPVDSVKESKSALDYLYSRGFTEDQIDYYDMRVGNIDFELGRIIVPNEVYKLVYTDFYSARSFIGQSPKYHNPAVNKSETVFNLHRIKEGEPVIIVEGALTAVAAGRHAVATLGKTLSRSQASQILMKHPPIIYVNYDYGAEEFSGQACKLLKRISPDTKVMQVFMKDDRDAADLTKEEYVNCLDSAIEYNPILEGIEFLTSN